jgi:hypothetical protein
MRAFYYTNQFILFYLQGQRVPVLSILYQEHHQKRHNRGSRIYNQLPGIEA